MSDEIKPALTQYEWREVLREPRQHLWHGSDDEREDAHHGAAVRLYGQPFGFTREDVEYLRAVVGHRRWVEGHDADRMQSIAARIEALLPPEE